MTTQPATPAAPRIHAITVRINSHRTLRSVTFSVNKTRRSDDWVRSEQDCLKATLTPPLDILPTDQLTLDIHASRTLVNPTGATTIKIPATELVDEQEFKKIHGDVVVTIILWDGEAVSGTVNDILRICPKFRILLIGKTGVGKSSLINEAFGVDDASVSNLSPGKADIEKEIISKKNPQFVLHDSRGFEPGEQDTFETVCEFIKARDQMPDLKDKLHAIWYHCSIKFTSRTIPVWGDRLLETGLEELFRLQSDGALGNVPLIAVFTKFDQLVTQKARRRKDNEDPFEQATRAFENDCLKPFQEKVKSSFPYRFVSTQKGYGRTLADLILITFENIQAHVGPEASVVAAIAQKPSPKVKIEGCIAVGKLRYWKGLECSVNFPGKTLEACSDIIHSDIVAVWDLDDPSKNLKSKKFKLLMSRLVSGDIQGKSTVDPNKGLGAGIVLLGAIAGVVGALSGPAAPIVIPIVGGLVLAKWAYDVYDASSSNLEHLMTYIVDHTLVMQNVFFLMEGKHPTSKKLISLALYAYSRSSFKEMAQTEISEHINNNARFVPGARDATLQKLEEIIRKCTVSHEEFFKLMDQIPLFHSKEDDDHWYTITEQSHKADVS
ncbi:hypothetical protein FRC17_010647 [Serendipita sp. 399]|nr:hypothetical protein FRC17_010647 [Serendipita sp. 399]